MTKTIHIPIALVLEDFSTELELLKQLKTRFSTILEISPKYNYIM